MSDYNTNQHNQRVESVGDYIESKRCPLCGIVPTEELCKAMEKLEEEPETKWIPCSERLPEDLEEVNVTWVNHIPEPYYDFLKDKPFTGSAVYYRGEWFWYSSRCVDILAEYGTNGMDKVDDGVEITAWMPLPEPYKEEQE